MAGLLIAYAGGPGGALLFDAVTFVVSIGLLLPLRPRVVEEVLHEEDLTATTRHFWTSLREGWGEVRSGLAGGVPGRDERLPRGGAALDLRDRPGADAAGARRRRSWAVIVACFGVGNVLGDLLFLRWRPRFALRVASLLLVGASCQTAMIGSGLGTWEIGALELLAGVCVTGAFTLWETCLGEHVPGRSLSRVSSYDYLATAGVIPLGNLIAGAASAAYGLRTLLAMTVIGVAASGGRGRARRAHVAAGRGHGARPGLGRLGQRHVHRQRHQGVVGGEVHDVGLDAGGPAGRVEAARPRRVVGAGTAATGRDRRKTMRSPGSSASRRCVRNRRTRPRPRRSGAGRSPRSGSAAAAPGRRPG